MKERLEAGVECPFSLSDFPGNSITVENAKRQKSSASHLFIGLYALIRQNADCTAFWKQKVASHLLSRTAQANRQRSRLIQEQERARFFSWPAQQFD